MCFIILIIVFANTCFSHANDERMNTLGDITKNSYYAFGKDPTVYADEDNRHYRTTFELQKSNGDMILTVLSKKHDGVELNLQYNFCPKYKSIEESSLNLSIDRDDSSLPKGADDDDEVFIIGPVKISVLDMHNIATAESPKAIDKGIVILTAGEEFRKREKIWDADRIWDHLLKYTKNQPDKKYRVKCHVLIKIDDKFYSAHPYFVIDGRAVVAMQRVRERLEREQKNKESENYGKEFLLEFEENDNEILLKGKEIE